MPQTFGKMAGSVVDSVNGQPVPFSSVALMNPAGKLVMGAVADEQGAFLLGQIPYGTYKLVITSVGYQPKTLFNVSLSERANALDLKGIRLRPDTKMLKEVTVTGQRALIEDKGDRLVYNAEKDISNVGGSAADVLRKVPMLSVDLNGNVQLRGSGNFRIFLNGKPSAMMARNQADALRQLPGSNIKSVEVITSPGAKYDAEGTAGIINIITIKRWEGFNGSSYASVGNLSRSIGGNVNVQEKKLGISATGGLYQYRSIGYSEANRTTLVDGQPANDLFQRSKYDNTGLGGNIGINLDYDLDSTTRINMWLSGWGGNSPFNSSLYSRLSTNNGSTLQEFKRAIDFNDFYRNGEVNLGYTKTFKRRQIVYTTIPIPNTQDLQAVGHYVPRKGPDPEFSVLAQYSHTPDRNYYTSDQFTLDDIATYRERSTNLSKFNELTFQSDYTYPFQFRSWKDTTQATLEVGAKAIMRDIGSDYTLDQALDGSLNYVSDPTRSNKFDYAQQVLSGYTSLRLIRANNWVLITGARLEHTFIGGNFVSTSTSVNRQYQNFIPNLSLSRKFKDKHTLRLSYTQRITRPQVGFLNPYVNFSNPQNLVTGNPELDPELAHSSELAYSTFIGKGIFVNTAVYLRQTNNAIEYVSTVNASGVSISRPQNIARRSVSGLQINTNAQPVKNMTVAGGGTLQRVSSYSPVLRQGNEGWIWDLSATISYRFLKTITVQANGNYSSGRIALQGRSSGWYGYAFSARKEILNRRASLNLSVNTPFNRVVRQKSVQDAPTFTSYAYSANVTRSALVSFYWQFGQNKGGNGKVSKKVNNDDKTGSTPASQGGTTVK
ncbi:outer membrane beta-barrel family protein [Nibrella saemangeumensis]|uniref:Outer membrane beta-barrel family protein n=2 Tax=Nibrella saemangeumensis TaxID=1084526 RepID=A0ABP8MPU8_9BACT